MTPIVQLLKGLPGSGKSTYAVQRVRESDGKAKRINRDSLRKMFDDSYWTGIDANEKFVTAARDALVLLAVQHGYDVVVDDTNLAPKNEKRISQLVGNKAIVVVNDSFLQVPLEVCIKQDLQREKSVGKDVILGMYHQFVQKGEFTKSVQAPAFIPDVPWALIVDLDGTMALIGDRSPYDGENCAVDFVNTRVAHLVQRWYREFAQVRGDGVLIFCSGRNAKARPASIEWLADEAGFYVDNKTVFLYTREDEDYRKDSIVKQEIYEREIKGKYNVDLVLDDRSSVVSMWRSQGLTCLQVAPGDF